MGLNDEIAAKRRDVFHGAMRLLSAGMADPNLIGDREIATAVLVSHKTLAVVESVIRMPQPSQHAA